MENKQLQTILTDLDNKALTKHQAYELILLLFKNKRSSSHKTITKPSVLETFSHKIITRPSVLETLQSEPSRDAEIILQIKKTFKSGDDISTSIIQRKYLTGYNLATRVFNQLTTEGFINKAKKHPLEISKIK